MTIIYAQIKYLPEAENSAYIKNSLMQNERNYKFTYSSKTSSIESEVGFEILDFLITPIFQLCRTNLRILINASSVIDALRNDYEIIRTNKNICQSGFPPNCLFCIRPLNHLNVLHILLKNCFVYFDFFHPAKEKLPSNK